MNGPDKRIAIIVDPSLSLGLIANTVATIGIGIGAVDADLGNTPLTDVTGRAVKTSANRPAPRRGNRGCNRCRRMKAAADFSSRDHRQKRGYAQSTIWPLPPD